MPRTQSRKGLSLLELRVPAGRGGCAARSQWGSLEDTCLASRSDLTTARWACWTEGSRSCPGRAGWCTDGRSPGKDGQQGA